MQVVAKTPRIDLRMKGEIPKKVLKVLEDEYGKLEISSDAEDLVDITTTDWYQEIKTNMTPGKTLKAYRTRENLTQVTLGEKIGGIPRQHISNMEADSRTIGKSMAKKLAEVLGFDYRLLL